MAGSLPGVECARRRRFHQSGGCSDSPSMAAHGCSRRSSFCLYTSSHDQTHHHASSTISSLQRSIMSQASEYEKLGGAAREARERLDERFKTKRKSETKRQLSGGRESLRRVNGRPAGSGELHTEVFGPSKSCSSRSGSRRFSWSKLTWKASEQDDCAICLERFKPGESLVHLPCAHRFHGRCLVPWLEANAHCPCCRMEILPPPSPSPSPSPLPSPLPPSLPPPNSIIN